KSADLLPPTQPLMDPFQNNRSNEMPPQRSQLRASATEHSSPTGRREQPMRRSLSSFTQQPPPSDPFFHSRREPPPTDPFFNRDASPPVPRRDPVPIVQPAPVHDSTVTFDLNALSLPGGSN